MDATGTINDRVASHPEPEANSEELPVRFGELLVGKYRVDQVLGKGGMAVVLAGTHVQLDAPIAIKLLLPTQAGNHDAVKRFLSEARAAAQLKSPNVAHISDVGTAPTKAGSLPFIVMERLDGADFASLMEDRKKLPVSEALDLVRQACRGLEEAHAAGIVHRDIKPANLFLTKTREGAPLVKVLDFGISKTIAAVSSSHQRAITRDNDALGSPGYMSPEQVKAAKGVDVRTDIWSLGVVLHELVSGAPCFDGDELQDIFAAILHGEPPALGTDVPADVRAIVRRCLQKDAAKRFGSAAELTQALTDVVEGKAPASVKARPPFSLIGLGIAVAAVVCGAALFVHPKPEPEPAPTALSLENAVTAPPPPAVSAASATAVSAEPAASAAASASAAPPKPDVAKTPPPNSARVATPPPAPKPLPVVTATASVEPPAPSAATPSRQRTDW